MGDKEYKAHHILVATEAEAKDAIARIKKGGKFDKIAQEKSLDAGSKNKGGELDWSPAASYVQPFAEALTKLSKGQLTEQPVKTPFGWHVIRLDDVRPLKIPPFEEIKQNLAQRVLQRQFATYVADLRAKAERGTGSAPLVHILIPSGFGDALHVGNLAKRPARGVGRARRGLTSVIARSLSGIADFPGSVNPTVKSFFAASNAITSMALLDGCTIPAEQVPSLMK